MRRKQFFVVLLLFISLHAIGQQDVQIAKKRMMDSITSIYLDAYALKYPALRQFNISQEFVGSGTIQSAFNGKELLKGNYWVSQTSANINIPIVHWSKNTFSASVTGTSQVFHLSQVEDYSGQLGNLPKTTTKTSLLGAVSYTRNDSLFGKPVLLSLSGAGFFDAGFSHSKLTYSALVLFTLKRTPTTSISIGGIFIVDPSATIPFAPIVNYWHKIKAINADLFIDAPYRLAVRKEIKQKSSLTAFGMLAGNQSFYNLKEPALPETSIYSTLDVKAGLLYEYLFSKKMVFSVSGGLFKTLSSKMAAPKDKINTDYFLKNKNEMAPYINVGISLLPFWKGIH